MHSKVHSRTRCNFYHNGLGTLEKHERQLDRGRRAFSFWQHVQNHESVSWPKKSFECQRCVTNVGWDWKSVLPIEYPSHINGVMPICFVADALFEISSWLA